MVHGWLNATSAQRPRTLASADLSLLPTLLNFTSLSVQCVVLSLCACVGWLQGSVSGTGSDTTLSATQINVMYTFLRSLFIDSLFSHHHYGGHLCFFAPFIVVWEVGSMTLAMGLSLRLSQTSAAAAVHARCVQCDS